MKRRSLREMAVRVVLLLIGLWIAHLGVTLFLQTNLGSDPFNVFVQGLFRAIPWPEWAGMTHGRVHLLVSLLIMVVLLVVDRSYVGIGTVLCMALGGPIIDVYTLWLAPFLNETLPLAVRVPMLAVGCVVAFAVSMGAIRFLMDYVKRHNFKFFGVYRIVLGLIVLAVAAITALA